MAASAAAGGLDSGGLRDALMAGMNASSQNP
jgi:hypothetical protein